MFKRRGWSRSFCGSLIALVATAAIVTPAAADVAYDADTNAAESTRNEIRIDDLNHAAEDALLVPNATETTNDEAGPSASPTGHEVALQFQQFYDNSGGLPTFGYAISPPVIEQDRFVQYFERQRFERHPENDGTPYAVLLGRLGVTAAERNGLLETAAFQPLSPETASDDNCWFAPETGHRLCGEFLRYWQSEGLEFGDAGVSYRESLALFGYPISEEYTDPATGLTVQYFERARFEHHPENAGTDYEVLLGLLGGPLWSEAAPTAVEAPAERVAEETQDSIGVQIAAEAMKHLGAPYVWAGTTPAGFDCSGFTYYVVNQVIGGGFPRMLDGQIMQGVPVDPGSLQPGDLVFQQNTYQWGLSHAGIYIGNGQFIHAANESTGVIISDLWDSYWGQRFYTARRIVG